jgi:heme exporter protein A
MNAMPLQARQVAKSFGVSPLLRGVNLEVCRGECAIIVGRNGSGKSTLIRILAGLLSVTAGEVLLFGQLARTLQPRDRRRIGLITHQSFLYPRLTARENLEFYAQLYGLDDRAKVVLNLLSQVGLQAVADERVSTFSRGMDQRLTLARAIIAKPDVLLMDEPFTALDAEGIELAIRLIGEASDRGCATVITAHEDAQFRGVNSTIYALVSGRLCPPSADSIGQQIMEHSAAAG